MAIPDAAGLLALGRVALHTGDEQQTRKCAQIARATLAAGAFDDGRRHVVWLLALQAMARGDMDGAREELRPDPDKPPASLLPVLAREVGMEPHLVRLALATRDQPLADLAVRDAAERARPNPGIADIAGTASHTRGLRDDDLSELLNAVDLLDGQFRPLVLASALEDLGRAHVERVHTDQGVRALERALELYHSTGATWDARRTRRRLRALGVRRRSISVERPLTGWDALTDSEREVAQLVAGGLTNAKAAERLFVSPHTIGTHLRRVFTKLGVNSRVELARVALQQERRT